MEFLIEITWNTSDTSPMPQFYSSTTSREPFATDVKSMLWNTSMSNVSYPAFLPEFLICLQQLIDGEWYQGKWPVLWAHASIIRYDEGHLFLYDDLNYQNGSPKGIVVKIKPLHFVRYLWHFVLCQIEKTDQKFTLPLEVIPSADLPNPLD